MQEAPVRCVWANQDPLLCAYHDQEWGVVVNEDQRLFEFLILEGMQAGLSWLTVLKKRENFRRALNNFDPYQIAQYTPEKQQSLLRDPGLIRNRLKINACVNNARAFLAIINKQPFRDYLYQMLGRKKRINAFKSQQAIPSTTPDAQLMSRQLKCAGFVFVGPTICYSFMQAVGMVNDHTTDCFRYRSCC